MRTITNSVSLAVVLFAAVLSNANACGSVQVSVGGPAGYVSYNSNDYDDMDREDLVVIDNNQVGFWVMLPSGRWVFRCRSMWYDSGWDEWCYGPWWDNYSISFNYNGPFHLFGHYNGVWYHSFMYNHYPRYWERTYGHRALPFRDRLERDAGHMRPEDRRDRNWTPSVVHSNRPNTIVETTRIITPARTQSADRDGGLRKAAEVRQPGMGAQVNPRPQSMGNMGRNDRGQSQPSGNRPAMRRELGRR
jgi:hypothetical protein